jgi:dethiobiotin synthetase
LHVKRALFQFPAPVSPHLAAREAATPIDPTAVIAFVDTFRASADVVVVELAGGLFTPLADDYSNADLLRELSPNTTVLVAPDRLGVLHDVTAAFRAAATVPAAIHLAVLLSPANTDASTGRNAAELFRILRLPTHSLPRGPTADLAVHSEMADVLARIAHGP